MVAASAHRWKQQRALRDAQVEIGQPQHKLVTERQKMIQRLLEQEKAVTQVLSANRLTRHLVLMMQEGTEGWKMSFILFTLIHDAACKLQSQIKRSVLCILYIVINIVMTNFLEISQYHFEPISPTPPKRSHIVFML